MRVVDITQWYAPASGGIRTYLHAKARWAAEQSHDHGVVITGPRAASGSMGQSPARVVRGRVTWPGWGYRLAAHPQGVLAALDRLAPSVVVVHDAMAFPRAAAEWARSNGAVLAMVCHSDLRLAAAGLPTAMRRPVAAALGRVQRRALAEPDLVMAASANTAGRLGEMARVPVTVNPLAVDVATFAAARPDAQLRRRVAGSSSNLLLYAGRLSSEKRVVVLADTLAALGPGWQLVLAGSGPDQAKLLRRARSLGVADRVTALGHLGDRATLARLMATCDCMVHPNPEEPFGLAMLEAMAAGCRLVAPRGVGIAALIAAHGAELVAEADGVDLADGVRAAMERPRPSGGLGTLSWERTFRREWELYADLWQGRQ